MILETLDALKSVAGKEIGVASWVRISKEQIRKFAEDTNDAQWIHVDSERAQRESPYGATIAHGFLTLALLSQFFNEVVQIRSGVRMAINYGLNRVRFPAAVVAGTRIRGRFSILAVKELADGIEVTFSVVVEGEELEKPVCVAEWIVRYLR